VGSQGKETLATLVDLQHRKIKKEGRQEERKMDTKPLEAVRGGTYEEKRGGKFSQQLYHKGSPGYKGEAAARRKL